MPDLDRSSCPGSRHGTACAYSAYGCRCPDARELWRLYRKRRREGRHTPVLVDAIGASRRLKALCALGWSQRALAVELGWPKDRVYGLIAQRYPRIHRRTAGRVEQLFSRLSMTVGPAARARKIAVARGWAPPLAWDEDTIDDPAAVPILDPPDSGEADVAVVERVAGGLMSHELLDPVERAAVVEELWDLGAAQTARRTGMPDRTVQRIRARLVSRTEPQGAVA